MTSNKDSKCKPIDIAYMRECFNYDVSTGQLFWKDRPAKHFKNQRYCDQFNKRYAGSPTGSLTTSKKSDYNYLRVTVNGIQYLCHRIAWAIFYNEDPPEDIDHINRNATDNRITNLRPSSVQGNRRNASLQSNNKSGQNGVCFLKRRGVWWAFGKLSTKRISIGYFKDFEDARNARLAWEEANNFSEGHGTPKRRHECINGEMWVVNEGGEYNLGDECE